MTDRTWDWPLGPWLTEGREHMPDGEWTRARAAAAAGMGASTWSTLERGYRLHPRRKGVIEPPRLAEEYVVRAAEVLHLDPTKATVLYEEGLRSAGKFGPVDVSDTWRPRDVHRQISALSPRQQQLVRGLVDEFTRLNTATGEGQ